MKDGPSSETTNSGWQVATRLFLRGLGLVYAAAFVSLAVQVEGLIGEIGVLPAVGYFKELANQGAGFWSAPSVFRLLSDDVFLIGTAWFGAALGLVVALGFLQGPLLLVCWALYLSFMIAGQDFLAFQWDLLLLEAGALALVLAPWRVVDRVGLARGVSGGAVALPLWLLLRLMVQSGLVKLASGDESWRDLTAMTYHFETQPLPNPLAYAAHHMPRPLLQAASAGTLLVELVLAWVILAPRKWRAWGILPLGGLQLGIMATGNYGFFNVLTLLLCGFLLDDAQWRRVLPGPLFRTIYIDAPVRVPLVRRAIAAVVLASAVIVGITQTMQMYAFGEHVPGVMQDVARGAQRFRLVSRYGLFAVMTKTRPEIIVEGSDDGINWKRYDFRYKVSDPRRRPPVVPLHMPRLDWQMWFAALAGHHQSPWFVSFLRNVLEGSEPVVALLDGNPFKNMPPRFVRAGLHMYEFTEPAERAATGAWWKATYQRDIMPPISLR